jgi:hypothetical protein
VPGSRPCSRRAPLSVWHAPLAALGGKTRNARKACLARRRPRVLLPRPTGHGIPTAAPSASWAGAGVPDRRGSGGDAPGNSRKQHSAERRLRHSLVLCASAEPPPPRRQIAGLGGPVRRFGLILAVRLEGEASGHVEPDFAVGSDVRPEDRGQFRRASWPVGVSVRWLRHLHLVRERRTQLRDMTVSDLHSEGESATKGGNGS